MSSPTPDDFGAECREAFTAHVAKLAAVNPNEPGRRNPNRRRRQDLLDYIDGVLDQYNDWTLIAPVDFPVDTDTLGHITRGSD